MNTELVAGPEFKQLSTKLRGAPKAVRQELNKAIKQATAPAEAELKNAVLGLDTKGSSGGGARQRLAAANARSKSGTAPKSANHGLRRNTAKGVTRKITYSGTRTGVRLRVDSKYLPASQRNLPSLMNKGRWRHPAGLGKNHGSVWVDQVVTPKGWFDNTVRKYGPKAAREINAAARRAMDQLQ